MGLLIFCCPQAISRINIMELTITSYAWMRTPEEQAAVDAEKSKKPSNHPNIERLMRAEWDIRHIRESITETGDGGYCIVCFDSFEQVKESKLIPCGHKSICPKCAMRLISMRGKNTTCPQCRHVVWKFVVMKDKTSKKKLDSRIKDKSTEVVLEDVEDKANKTNTNMKVITPSPTEVIDSDTKKNEGLHNVPREIERHCNVCFRPFFNKIKMKYPTNHGPVLQNGIKVRETKLYPCGHQDVCVTCAGLITAKEVRRECPQCRRFVRRYTILEEVETSLEIL